MVFIDFKETFLYNIPSKKELNIFSIILRVNLAVLCGGILGIERGRANQSAGMRTYILVCLGATIVMLTGEYTFYEFNSGDPARLGAQVISGIGFLGAGSIIVEGNTKVRGLTTAAGLWAAACIGLVIGVGFYSCGIIATIAVYIVISKFRTIANYFTHNDMWLRVYVEFESISHIQMVCSVIESFGLQIGDVMLNNPNNSGNYNAIISFKNTENKSDKEISSFIKKLEGIETVKFVY